MLTGIQYLSHPPGCGLGAAAEDYIAGLRAAGVPVSWVPLEYGTGTWGPGQPLAPVPGHDVGHLGGTTIVHSTPPLWNDAWSRPGRYIAYATYEADRLPPHWAAVLNRYDAVLVPSNHSRQVFLASGVTVPVTVIPHIARPQPPAPSTALIQVPPTAFVFYLIGTWTARKAVPDTVRAFLGAFTGRDDVALVLKTTAEDRVAVERARRGLEPQPGRFTGQSWFSLARLLAGHADPPPIRLIAGDVPAPLIGELHTRGDCFVSLARGEGWGLGAFEAGAAGHPVVLTGWGGHLDYLPPGYPYQVRYNLVPTGDDEPDDWFVRADGQRWARADVARAGELLREIYQQREASQAWGRQLQSHILSTFGSDQVIPRLLQAIDSAPAYPSPIPTHSAGPSPAGRAH
jgi:glycosyltransferase involved in cell wall biosynthesis